MTNEKPRGSAGPSERVGETVSGIVAPDDDLYAWTGIYLVDCRVISIAWLRGYPGATTSTWRRYRDVD
jgi:hypothetical protein